MIKKRNQTYRLIAWTVIPCPYLNEKEGAIECAKMCKSESPDMRKDTRCIDKVVHETKSCVILMLLKMWNSIWYDYITVDVLSEEDSVEEDCENG